MIKTLSLAALAAMSTPAFAEGINNYEFCKELAGVAYSAKMSHQLNVPLSDLLELPEVEAGRHIVLHAYGGPIWTSAERKNAEAVQFSNLYLKFCLEKVMAE